MAGERRVPPAALAALASAALLALCGSFVRWDTIFLKGMSATLNDQVGFISLARNYAERGLFESNFLNPVTLTAAKPYFYMPGHYWALAASYRLFGYSPAHSFWPSLAAFLITAVATFEVTRELFGSRPAWLSWALFAGFPANLIYSFTAMAEMTVQASAMAALWLFVKLPARWRPWLGPAAIALPVFFRETGLVVAFVMAGILWRDSKGRWKPVLVFGALAAATAVAALQSPVAKGRPSLLRDTVFAGYPLTGAPSAADWLKAIGRHFGGGVSALIQGPRSEYAPGLLETASVYFIVSGIPIALWLWWRRRDGLYLWMGAGLAALLGSILGLYMVWWFRGLRVLLLAQPVAAMLWADALRNARPSLPRWAAAAVAAAALLCGVAGVRSVFGEETELTRQAGRDIAFFESLAPDPSGVLASPWDISLDYALKHHPQKWAFPPGSDAELLRLNARYPVGMMLKAAGDHSVSDAATAAAGLRASGEVEYGGARYRVFRR